MSIAFNAADLARWTEGCLIHGASTQSFDGVSIDSRLIEPGQLFIAIRGPRHDAHRYLEATVEKGVRGLLIERHRTPPSLPDSVSVVEVPDTTAALGQLAAGHRASFEGSVIAITGSCGKTTTKELCAAIVERMGPCLRTLGNLNNQFGLPLTLLRREAEHRYAVVELGTNHPGEIAPLAAIAKPCVSVITNIGSAHIEFFGSQAQIAREKAGVLDILPADGVAVLNADDPFLPDLSQHTKARILRFGRSKNAEFRATKEERTSCGFRFALSTPAGVRSIQVPGVSATLVPNALAAAAAAFAVGASLSAIEEGLATYRSLAGRMQLHTLRCGAKLIDDTYNANPQSMAAALKSLSAMAHAENRRAIAVLGDMGELGEFATEAHRDLGEEAASIGTQFLIGVGKHASEISEGARAAGLSPERIIETATTDEAATALRKLLDAGDLLLLKGSRSVGMERIIEVLLEGESA